jgi:dipeptidyl aminopeptidase/acylaminoacyl peptidase
MVAASGGAIGLHGSSRKRSARGALTRYLAFLSRADGGSRRCSCSTAAAARRPVDYKTGASAIAWSPDSSKLALLVSDPDPNDPDGTDEKDKKPKPHVITRLQFMRDGDGYLNDVKRHIHVFDIATRADLQLTSDRYDDGPPAWARDGSLIAFSANRTDNPDANDNSDIFVIEPRAGATPRAVTTSPGSDGSPVFSPDGTSIAYLTGGDSKDIWYATNNVALVPAAGGAAKILTAGLDRNLSRPQFSHDGSGVIFLLEEGGNSHLARVPTAGGAVVRVLGGEREVAAFDIAKTGDIAVLDSQPQQPGEIYLLRGASAVPAQLTHVNDEFLAKVALGTVERFQAKSADGTMIDAYLTRPANAPAAKLPAILRIHGGPVAQYSTGFNLEWQMLAARGFVVVAANPRGSSGYGRDFSRAIFADWGNKDYDDVMAAVDTAIAMGVADPDRLGVGGWSYGGILTDHVISKTTRFKAAISGAGEFNHLANYGTGSLPAAVGGRARPAVAEHGALAQAVAVLPSGQDRHADAGRRRRRRHERADPRRPAVVSGAAAPRPRDRARHLSRRDPLDPAPELPAGSLRAILGVVCEIPEAGREDVVTKSIVISRQSLIAFHSRDIPPTA